MSLAVWSLIRVFVSYNGFLFSNCMLITYCCILFNKYIKYSKYHCDYLVFVIVVLCDVLYMAYSNMFVALVKKLEILTALKQDIHVSKIPYK